MNSIASGTVLRHRANRRTGKGCNAGNRQSSRARTPRPSPGGAEPVTPLTEIVDDARTAGATAYEIGCDLARLADVRAAGLQS